MRQPAGTAGAIPVQWLRFIDEQEQGRKLALLADSKGHAVTAPIAVR